jgi:glycosyltransferase involved in cell wall biosynthesis
MGGPRFANAPVNNAASVAILLCTYNGEKFLQAQLESIANQSYYHWQLFVSDDGSTDRTLELIERFASAVGPERVQIFSGPRRGFAQNFLSLIVRPEIDCPYIAFADQDDVWLVEKLACAVAAIKDHSITPALYVGRTRYIDDQDQVLGESAVFSKPPRFANALVQSIGGGNTMMINQQTLGCLRAIAHPLDIVSHDWWLYLLVTALEGLVYYDHRPWVLYRQHGQNLVGMNTSFRQKWHRIQRLLAGDFRRWNDRNIKALNLIRPQMSEQICAVFDAFVYGRQQGLYRRVTSMLAARVYRQTNLGNLGLWFAIFTNRV